MMLAYEHEVARSRLAEEFHPRLWIELPGGEAWDEIVVLEAAAVGADLVPVCLGPLLLHGVPVPLRVDAGRRPGGDGIEAIVNEDAELGAIVPFRRLVGTQRGIRRAEPGDVGERERL